MKKNKIIILKIKETQDSAKSERLSQEEVSEGHFELLLNFLILPFPDFCFCFWSNI